MRPDDSLLDFSAAAPRAPATQVPPAPADWRAPPAQPAVPPVRAVELGRSVGGAPLTLEVFGAGPRPVLILGGVHGDETLGAEMARCLSSLLREDRAAAGGRSVAILAAANPDGMAAHRRTNANGVDLNRNFPAHNWRPSAEGRRDYGGPRPASEPETRAIMRAVEGLRPAMIIAIHCAGRGAPCNNYDGPAREVAVMMAAGNDYPVRASIGYPTPGSLGNWAGVDRSIPIITLELPGGASGAACWQRNRGALLAAIRGGLAM